MNSSTPAVWTMATTRDGLFYSPLSLSNGKLIVPEEGKNQRPIPPLWIDLPTSSKIKKYWVGLIDL